jgi:hypothetical protein
MCTKQSERQERERRPLQAASASGAVLLMESDCWRRSARAARSCNA